MNGHRFSVKHEQDTPVAEDFKKKKHKMVVRVLQGAQEDITMRRSLDLLFSPEESELAKR